MKEQQVTFSSQNLTLEGLYAPPPAAAQKGAVVCHPHPQYGGSMYNNVVDAALEAFWAKGFATLRFNFRGVGESEGSYGGGQGEAQDAVAAVSYLRGQPGMQAAPIILAGYSFGAAAAWRAAPQAGALEALVLIAAPLQMMRAGAVAPARNIVLIGGSQDTFCSAAGLKDLCARLGKTAAFRVIDGADHFFGGYEEDVTAALGEMLTAAGL
ncbi:MAG TPA: alpha/beta fold hydrolase [Candidatus Binataceae bacterium]|nr:alpha/beta fold hydrolase [Candidatus Binataceae bacterium]